MAESAQEEFKQAMLIQDNDGNTPLHGAYLSVAEIMEQTAPEEFKQAMSIKNQDGLTLSDINLGLNHITFN